MKFGSTPLRYERAQAIALGARWRVLHPRDEFTIEAVMHWADASGLLPLERRTTDQATQFEARLAAAKARST